ncbi:MAG: hypothetical protein WCU88_02350 [Elusimicrobiota bacterium]|jgi:N-acylneuraminate cytidylyltransferase
MFAYIPARGGSKRIPRKNVRPLGGRPVLLRVIDALSKVHGLSGIGVSSEDPEILGLAESHGAARTLGPRDISLADDNSTFMDLLRSDAPRFARAFKDDSLLFVVPTAALVQPAHYEEALRLHQEAPEGLVLAVRTFPCSPYLALSGDPKKGLIALFPEMYLRPTKELSPAFTDAGCFYALHLDPSRKIEKFLDLSPVRGVVLPEGVGIDVDTSGDWDKLEKAHSHLAANMRRPPGD